MAFEQTKCSITDYYKAVEDMLYGYKAMHAEIKNIELEIAELENEYQGCGSISYEEKSAPTNKFNSPVENEMISKRYKLEWLKKRKHKLEVKIKKIDNELSILTDREYKIIELRYFENISNKDVAIRLDLAEQRISEVKSKIINKLINLVFVM
ncbi:sigma factor-like helix-turn-helix DNA-binding protein [Clostridium akagii]|uniref:sigma factor-like helix-turn-helix DNA-binding protein n=1 Tax=Clostridium akagii TaxID=91623 RepID=UPI00068BFF61|nr:sigma factor-like helix-turn-helix DNA-binding protein [Clostridium akagii]